MRCERAGLCALRAHGLDLYAVYVLVLNVCRARAAYMQRGGQAQRLLLFLSRIQSSGAPLSLDNFTRAIKATFEGQPHIYQV